MRDELSMTPNPFDQLGLPRTATAGAVRTARRELARTHHPDAGGDAEVMRVLNVAAAEALRLIASDVESPVDPVRAPVPTTDWVGTTRDFPSFTVESLPAETFEALLVATAELGEVEDDDPPYELRTLLSAPLACWCQLDIVPEAGASTVSVTIAPVEGHRLPSLIDVRNAWITALNGLDWSSF
jgi:hypothetical protein